MLQSGHLKCSSDLVVIFSNMSGPTQRLTNGLSYLGLPPMRPLCSKCGTSFDTLNLRNTHMATCTPPPPVPGPDEYIHQSGRIYRFGYHPEYRIGPPEDNVKPDGILINFQPLGDLQLSPLPAVRANTVSIYPH